ncbi:MAG TPA: 23S rRNA (pseudouridine(1915)-N(3))-methyltransferase RlmH [Terriglobia bacterium]|nr:23S rRNA (pseudouridine(1915)-N(3))-methyltransferase RlmH [Terriglobia bacterium]
MRIRIICEGKIKDPNLRAVQADFRDRIAHFGEIVVEEIHAGKNANQGKVKGLSATEKQLLEKIKGSYKVFLDGRGREWTSEEFAEWLGEQALRGTREVAFVVGGPDGFSEAFRKQANHLLALSRMTLTRDWARALLLEQIYRGFTILRGFPYAR